jgi:hypothetical protein
MVSLIRQQLMNYINVYRFLEDPEGCWREVIYKQKSEYQNPLFPQMQGGLLLKIDNIIPHSL